jgi:hypothetical protein
MVYQGSINQSMHHTERNFNTISLTASLLANNEIYKVSEAPSDKVNNGMNRKCDIQEIQFNKIKLKQEVTLKATD